MRYNDLGLVESSESNLKRTKSRVLLLGDELVSGEDLTTDKRFSAVLRKKLAQEFGADVDVVNGGIRDVRTAYIASIYSRLLEEYEPDAVVYLIANAEHVSRDFLSIKSNRTVCPVGKLIELNIQFTASNILKNTFTELAGMKKISEKEGIRFLPMVGFWNIQKANFLDWLPPCGSFVKLFPADVITQEEFRIAAASYEISFPAAYYFVAARIISDRQESDPIRRRELYIDLLTEAMIGWIAPSII